MSIKTAKFQVQPLRGIDQRWQAKPNHAKNIENMNWSDQDSWTTAPGYRRIVRETVRKNLTETKVISVNIFDEMPGISSLFWFSQHGNALQWLIFEDKKGGLRYFNGSILVGRENTTGTNLRRSGTIIFDNMGKRFDGVAKLTDSITTLDSTKRARNCINQQSSTFYLMYKSNLYMVNGVDAPTVFDGRKVTRAGFSGKPATPGVFTTPKSIIHEEWGQGVGNVNSNNSYKYVVTFVNERGQESRFSNPTEIFRFNTVASVGQKNSVNGDVTFAEGSYKTLITLNLPKGPPGTVARRIYRTQNMVSFLEEIGSGSASITNSATESPREAVFGREFFFLAEVQDNVTTLYSDIKSDVELGSLFLAEDLGDFPRNTTMMAVYKNTLFCAGELNEELRYSAPMNPEVFPIDNVFNLSDNQTSLITGLVATGDSLVVFKHRAIYLVKGNPVNGFFAQTLTTDIGCVSNQSIKEVPGVGVVFLSLDGIYLLEGTYSDKPTTFFKLSQGLRETFNRINLSYAEKFRSIINHSEREYILSVCFDQSDTPNALLKFHYEIGSWSVYTDLLISGLVEVQDHRSYVYFAGPDDSSFFTPPEIEDRVPPCKGIYLLGGSNTSNINHQEEATGSITLTTAHAGPINKTFVRNRTSIYETVNLNFNGVYENFSPARIQSMIIGYGNTLTLKVFVNRESDDEVATQATSTQIRPLEDKDFKFFGNARFGIDVFREHRPIVTRLDISTLNKGPVNEIRLLFTSSNKFEIVNYALEARFGRTRDVITISEKIGGGPASSGGLSR